MMRVRGWRAVLIGATVVAAAASGVRAEERRQGNSTLPVIQVWKSRHEMWLEQHGRVTRKFHVSLGSNPRDGKLRQGDGRTPVGRYYISEKLPNSRYHRFLGISYPNVDDAERGFAAQLITADQWADILFANLRGETPPWQTPLGGRVGIHGQGRRQRGGLDWTQGCIAVSDHDIEYLYAVVPVGTPVHIHD
jgi:murein L,D-transpeptidase YafK